MEQEAILVRMVLKVLADKEVILVRMVLKVLADKEVILVKEGIVVKQVLKVRLALKA
jgi:hypothetical protein